MKKYSLKINGNPYEVKIEDINESSTMARVTVNGVKYDVEIEGGKASAPKKPQVAAAPEATGLSVTPKTPIATKPAAPAAAAGVAVADDDHHEAISDQEIAAAIITALKLYKSNLHDQESEMITIHRIARAYSPWSSKIHGLTQLPERK